jgi:hypothetical protein
MDPGSRSRCSLGRDDTITITVIAGLDPAIHLLGKTLLKIDGCAGQARA